MLHDFRHGERRLLASPVGIASQSWAPGRGRRGRRRREEKGDVDGEIPAFTPNGAKMKQSRPRPLLLRNPTAPRATASGRMRVKRARGCRRSRHCRSPSRALARQAEAGPQQVITSSVWPAVATGTTDRGEDGNRRAGEHAAETAFRCFAAAWIGAGERAGLEPAGRPAAGVLEAWARGRAERGEHRCGGRPCQTAALAAVHAAAWTAA
eukprot:364796-Chlamydomonas_euryale.AAC.12